MCLGRPLTDLGGRGLRGIQTQYLACQRTGRSRVTLRLNGNDDAIPPEIGYATPAQREGGNGNAARAGTSRPRDRGVSSVALGISIGCLDATL